MNRITLSWEDWRAVIAVLREKQLPYMREHADHIERLLERHGPDEPMVTLSLPMTSFFAPTTERGSSSASRCHQWSGNRRT